MWWRKVVILKVNSFFLSSSRDMIIITIKFEELKGPIEYHDGQLFQSKTMLFEAHVSMLDKMEKN